MGLSALYNGMKPRQPNWEHFRRLQLEFDQVSEQFAATEDVNLRRVALAKMHEVIAEMDAINDEEHQRLQQIVQNWRNARGVSENANKT
jgi:hypothetical protein